MLKIIKAGGTCVAAVALAVALAPAAGAATTHSSVAAVADHHQPRGQHGHRLAEGGGGWSHEDHWDGGWDGPNGSGADWGTDFSSGEDHMSDFGHYRDNPGGR